MLRFTIRDLLWLMVVVAMGLGWWHDRRRIAAWEVEAFTEVTRVIEKQYKHEIDLLEKENAALKSST